MSASTDLDFIRYLSSKRSVDDRALNPAVLRRLTETLQAAPRASETRILEVGAGIGAMVERILELEHLERATYTAIDRRPENIEEAARRLSNTPGRIHLELQTIDLFEFVENERGARTWDLLVASSFLDLVEVATTLPRLLDLVRPGGLCYFTFNFDGATILEPPIDPAVDAQVESLYHRTMDERVIDGRSSGDSRCGRHLFGHLRAAGTEILAAGSSDWVVCAGAGGYPEDEAHFLRCIVGFIEQALAEHPELDAEIFREWIRKRRAQIETHELMYVAHQLDFLARKPD